MKAIRRHNILVEAPQDSDKGSTKYLQGRINRAYRRFEESGMIQRIDELRPLYIDSVIEVPNGVELTAPSLHCEDEGGVLFDGQIQSHNHVGVYRRRWKGMWNQDWSKESTGIEVRNCRKCTFAVSAESFYFGLLVRGVDGGCVENRFFIESVRDNRYGVYVPNKGSKGWANQNQVFGGKVSGKHKRQYQGDSACIYIEGDNWSFYDVNLEGADNTWAIDCQGMYNQFLNCRYEGVAGKLRIDGHSNAIIGGYQVPPLESIKGRKTALTVIGPGFVHATGSLNSARTPVLKIHKGQSDGNIIEVGNSNHTGKDPFWSMDHKGTLIHYDRKGNPDLKLGEPGKPVIQEL